MIEYHVIPNWAPDPVCEVKMSPDRTGWMGAGRCLPRLARAQLSLEAAVHLSGLHGPFGPNFR